MPGGTLGGEGQCLWLGRSLIHAITVSCGRYAHLDLVRCASIKAGVLGSPRDSRQEIRARIEAIGTVKARVFGRAVGTNCPAILSGAKCLTGGHTAEHRQLGLTVRALARAGRAPG